MADWERAFEQASIMFRALGAIAGWAFVLVLVIFAFQVCG